MISAVSGVSALPDFSTASSDELADKGLSMLLEAPALLESLADNSFKFLPPSYKTILSTLWGLININENSTIVQSDIERAIREFDGNAAIGMALWSHMDSEGKGVISAGDYAQNDYLEQAISSMLETIRENVEQVREEAERNTASSNTLLDHIVPGGGSGSVLDAFSGSILDGYF